MGVLRHHFVTFLSVMENWIFELTLRPKVGFAFILQNIAHPWFAAQHDLNLIMYYGSLCLA
jgi:hypothetical protein